MAKIKLDKFEGIYTNVDENDSRFDLFKESANFRHEHGYMQFEPRNLSAMEMPPIDADAGDPPGTWEWETGIYSIITNDSYSFDPTPQQWNILLLIGKKLDSGTYYRRIYYQDLDGTDGWEDAAMSILPHMDYDIMSTTKDGDTKLVADQGAIKIYMPHDCFWFGRINRRWYHWYEYDIVKNDEGNYNFNDTMNMHSRADYNGFYLDRLVEPNSDALFQGSDIETWTNPAQYMDFANPDMRLKIFANAEQIPGDSLGDEELYSYSLCRRVFAGRNDDNHIFYFNILDKSGNWDGKSRLTCDRGYEFWESRTGDNTISPNCNDYPNGDCRYYNNWAHQLPPGFRIPGTTTYTTRAYYDSENVIQNQIIYYYDRAEKRLFAGPTDWVITATLDDTTEIVVAQGNSGNDPANPLAPTDAEKYFLKFKYKIPSSINARLTRISTYIREYTYNDTDTKWEASDTFERADVKTINVSPAEVDTWEQVHLEAKLSGSEFDGTTLASAIGIAYERGRYEIITGFRDYAKEAGIGIGIDYSDYVNVYHSVVGGGVLQSDLIYKENKLQLPGVSFVNALAPANGIIAAMTDVSMHVIKPSEVSGVLAFAILQSMNYGVKNFRDVAVIPGGFIMHTKTGIYFTNGYGTPSLLSEPINNIVKSNYDTGTIRYNPRLNELYYRPSANDDLYRFRFDRKVWELRNATVTTTIVQTLEEVAL